MNVAPSEQHPVHEPPLRSLADPELITGRDQPRDTTPYRHDLRLYGQPGGEVRACCTCMENGRLWARTFEPGHTPADFVRLEHMHISGRVS